MSAEFIWRVVGMILLALLGARFGAELNVAPQNEETSTLVLSMLGALAGLVLTPYFTTRPIQAARRVIAEMPAEELLTTAFGLIVGLIIAALAVVPLSRLPTPWDQWMPLVITLVASYLSVTIFGLRARDILQSLRALRANMPVELTPKQFTGNMKVLVDSSAIIDGRILDISKTGFLHGELIVPGFVLREIQHIADESNPQRRNRGRRGLEILEEMQRESRVPITVQELEADAREVDHKLVALAKQMDAYLLTTDYTLNRTANLQGVQVLNINDLANAVKAVILPNEVIALQIIAEGRESNQGVGYLDDGTMVVVEDARRYMDRKIDVVIMRMIQTSAGKMYFARPDETRK